MNENRHIRRAKIEDADRICELNKTGLGYNFSKEGTRQRLKAVLDLPAHRILVAEYDGMVAGYIHGSDYECTYCGPLKNILALAVDEKYRGRGVGRNLISAIEEWAKEEGSEGVRLVSGFERLDAHKFYTHCGYIERKDQKNFIKYLM